MGSAELWEREAGKKSKIKKKYLWKKIYLFPF